MANNQQIEDLAAEIGDKVYIDVAKWHLYLKDAKLHTTLAEQVFPLLNNGLNGRQTHRNSHKYLDRSRRRPTKNIPPQSHPRHSSSPTDGCPPRLRTGSVAMTLW